MPRSRFTAPAGPSIAFLNRDAQISLIATAVARHRADSRELAVFEVLGLGGAGKTRLVNEVRRRTEAGPSISHVLSVPLEGEASATEVGVLRLVRDQVPFGCHLFDAGLLRYLSATGQPPPSPEERITGSLVFKSADVVRALAHIPLPLTFATDAYRSASGRIARAWSYDDEEFTEIDELRAQPIALRERLPHWLGSDIRRRMHVRGDTLVAFFDGYDRLAPSTRARQAPWLRELIGTIDRGIHVIATREPTGWREDPDWAPVLQPVRVDDLPDKEARELIRLHLDRVPTDVEERLLAASHRIPFFLMAAIDDVRRHADVASVDVASLPSTPSAALDHLIDHLPSGERDLALALATVQAFDRPLFLALVRSLHLNVSGVDFDRFAQWFLIEGIGPGLYKTHDLLTASVHEGGAPDGLRGAALEAAVEHLALRDLGTIGAARGVLAMFRGACTGWASIPDMPVEAAERLIDVGYGLYDCGYWQELAAIALDRRVAPKHPTTDALEFLAAVTARRVAGVEPAIERFARLEENGPQLGRHTRSMEIEVAYLTELSGDYPRARATFSRLVEELQPFDANDRTHLRTRLWYADMMINDGAFLAASRLLLETYEAVDPSAVVMWAELVRHRGHAFRFSFVLDAAERHYRLAMGAAEHVPALQAKLHTNLAETLCWTRPKDALDAAAVSIECNHRLENRIEIAKCNAARAVAFARIGELEAARDAAAQASRGAHEVGYPVGAVFAQQAQAVIASVERSTDALAAIADGVDRAVSPLGSYGHLRVISRWLAAGEPGVRADVSTFGWIEPEGLVDRLGAYVSLP